MDLNKFLESQNGLVIGGDALSHYLLINMSTDEVWNTFPSPGDVTEIEDAIKNLTESLPMGKVAFRLQAITTAGQTRAQCNIITEGRNSAAPKNQNGSAEALGFAKVHRAHADVTEQQLGGMLGRYQEMENRLAESEKRAADMAVSGYQMMDIMNKLMSSKEDERRKQELHEASMSNVRKLGEVLFPMLEPLVAIAAKKVQQKVDNWEKEVKDV